LLQFLGNSGILLSMQEGSCGNLKTKMNIDEMNINDIFNQDNATMLINTDPLTGEHVETEQEWTAAHERELLAMDAEKNQN
tara:strand:- start:459 stop:701 length:243 start_codon:yes stop_codon:yes gene_type:complete